MIVLGKERVEKIITDIFESCNIPRDCDYSDYNGDLIYLTRNGELEYVVWYKFREFMMDWKLYSTVKNEILGEGTYNTETLIDEKELKE